MKSQSEGRRVLLLQPRRAGKSISEKLIQLRRIIAGDEVRLCSAERGDYRVALQSDITGTEVFYLHYLLQIVALKVKVDGGWTAYADKHQLWRHLKKI